MNEQLITDALRTGNVAEALAAMGPDEAYRMSFIEPCPAGHPHNDVEIYADGFRFGTRIYLLAARGSDRDGEANLGTMECADVLDATRKLGMFVQGTKALADLHKATDSPGGVFTVNHTANDEQSLVDTPFEDTVIPMQLPRGWGSV